LARWDLLVVDAWQQNVINVLSCGSYSSPIYVLARFDVGEKIRPDHESPIVAAVEWIKKLLDASKGPGDVCCFSGILLANWAERLSNPQVIELIVFAHKLGLSIYLETSSPGFLSNPKLAELDEVDGLVIRNGTISPNGDERDAFQMAEMRPAIKAFVSQACLRRFNICLWETLDDDAAPLNAVIRRTYQWCKFYSALPFITYASELRSLASNREQKEPLGAFSWLKEPEVMEAHRKWRLNHKVCSPNAPNLTFICKEDN
jgi:hypothetical protein